MIVAVEFSKNGDGAYTLIPISEEIAKLTDVYYRIPDEIYGDWEKGNTNVLDQIFEENQ